MRPQATDGNGAVSDDDFAELVRPLVEVLDLLTAAAAAMFDGRLPDPASTAMAELAAETSLADDAWPEPVTHLQAQIGFATFAMLDHVRAYGRLFEGGPVPVYAHFVLARAALDVGSTAWWLLDPSIDASARVLRGQVLRLASAREARRAPAPLAASLENGNRREAEVRAGASARGLSISGRNSKGPVRVGSQQQPTARAAIRAVLGPEGDQSRVGDLMWWLLSGHTHGGMHALMQAIVATPEGSDIEPQFAGIGTQSRTVHLLGATLGQLLEKVVDARAHYNGVSTQEWSNAKAALSAYVGPVAREGTAADAVEAE